MVNSGYATIFEMSQVIAAHYGISAESARSEEFKISARKTSSQMVENWMIDLYGLNHYIRDWRIALKEYLADWDHLDSPH